MIRLIFTNMQDYSRWTRALLVICDWSECLRYNEFYGKPQEAHARMRRAGWQLIEHNERHYDGCPDDDHLTMKDLCPPSQKPSS